MCASHDTRWAMPVSPRYRRFQQMHYHQYSERDAGISHLWHAHRLAEARLRPGPGITDAPETDFRHPERMDFSQTKACALMTRLQRRVVDEEKRIVKENRNMLRHMVDVSDDGYRERQGLNNYPSKAELKKWYRADEQVLARQRDRAHREANTRKKNLIVMKHLIDVKPSVESAKQLNKWYKLDHKRRVKELSQFNRMEPFAGANVLRKECGVKLPRRTPDSVELRTAVQQPLICGEYKIPTLMETLTTKPVLPSLQEAAENYAAGNLTLNETGDFAFTWTHTGHPKKKPGWKNISALDVRLMNYASDLMLARGGELSRVSREDENGVTRLWRRGLERNYRAKGRYMKEGEQQDTNVMDTINGGKGDRRVSKNTIMWDKDRWKSRTSIFTLLRTKSSKHFEKNYLESFNIPGGAAPRRQNEHRDGSMQTEPTPSLVFEESEKPLWEPLHMGAGPLFPNYDVFSKAAAPAVDEVRKTSRGSGVPYEHAAPAADEVRKTSRGSGVPYEHAAPAADEVRKTSRGSGVPYEHAAPAVDEVRKTSRGSGVPYEHAAPAVDEVRKTSRGSGVPYEHAAPAADEVRKTSRGSGVPYEHAAPAVDEVRKTSRGSGVPYEHAAPAVDEVRKTSRGSGVPYEHAAPAVDEVRKTSRGSGVPYEHAAPAVDEVRKTSRGSGVPYEHAAPAVDEVRKTSRGSGVPYEHAAPAVDEVRKTSRGSGVPYEHAAPAVDEVRKTSRGSGVPYEHAAPAVDEVRKTSRGSGVPYEHAAPAVDEVRKTSRGSGVPYEHAAPAVDEVRKTTDALILEKDPRRKRSLADWTAELRGSDTPFVPY